MNSLIPPNLAELGVIRRGGGEADLETIWLTPYPVISNYLWLMDELGWVPFGGGTRQKQRSRINGFITSGYRDKVLNGNEESPHLYAFAEDFVCIGLRRQIEVGRKAAQKYPRVGLYPDRGFIHCDVAPDNWIERYNKARYWVTFKGKTEVFSEYNDAAKFADGINHKVEDVG